MTPDQRYANIRRRIVISDSGCWEWQGHIINSGYGLVYNGQTNELVHRWVYKHVKGAIGNETIDHLCRNKKCCNPDHLECVSYRENMHRSDTPNIVRHLTDTCKRGHSLLDAYIRADGGRTCRECQRIYQANRRARIKAGEVLHKQDPSTLSTTCRKGHVFADVGVYMRDGTRTCAQCARDAAARARAKRKVSHAVTSPDRAV